MFYLELTKYFHVSCSEKSENNIPDLITALECLVSLGLIKFKEQVLKHITVQKQSNKLTTFKKLHKFTCFLSIKCSEITHVARGLNMFMTV